MRLRPYLLAVVILVIIFAAAAFLYCDRIAASALSKAYGLDISYKGCSKSLSGEFDFKNLSVVSRKTGLGITCTRAKLKPRFPDRKLLVAFDLTDVNFVKKQADEPIRYDTITALAADPFNGNWKYARMTGSVAPVKNGLKVIRFDALSDRIKLSLEGEFMNNGRVDSDMVVYFDPSLTDKIAPELAGTLLGDEKDGWKSLSVRVTGDVSKPAIQVSSKRFRLSIKSVSGS